MKPNRVVHCKHEPHDVYVGRPGPWGNPFSEVYGSALYKVATREEAISGYRGWLLAQPELVAKAKAELAGKVLGCWCSPLACHGEILAAIANPLVVFLDMDGVMADFEAALPAGFGWDPPEMFVPGFFRNLPVMAGAKEAIAALMADPTLDVYVGSKHTSKVTTCASEKMEWIKEHFPPLLRKVVLVCDKGLLRGDVLVDDDLERWKGKFDGKFIHFDQRKPRESWERVVRDLSLP